MSLPQVRLDDLRWDDLVDLAIRRIPAASDGRWTLHAPVDPGITLLELLAYLLEQRVYFLDQIPDSLIRAMLTLVGEAPKPARVARTVVSFQSRRPDPAPAADAFVAGAETILRPEDPALAHLALTTRESFVVLPLDSVAISQFLIDGTYRSTDLAQDRLTVLMPQRGGAGEIGVVLRMRAVAPAGTWASLLCDLETSVPAEWSTSAVDKVEPPTVIAFSYSGPNGRRIRLQDGMVRDGTGGLRRSGLIRFRIPGDWAPVPVGPSAEPGYVLWLRTESATYAEPPRLRRMVANCVVAVQQERRDLTSDPDTLALLQRQVRDWIPKSGLSLTLPPDRRRPLADDAITLKLQDRHDEWRRWSPVADLAFFGPGDRVFTIDRDHGRFFFGNGLNGGLPAPAKDIRLELTSSGGAEGNIGGNLSWVAEGIPDRSRLQVRNPAPVAEGEEAESVEAARQRVGAALFRSDRAITANDFEAIVERLSGIGGHRAHVAGGYDPRLPCAVTTDAVTVFVVPRIGRGIDFGSDLADPAVAGPIVDPGALALIRRRLDAARLIGTRVFIHSPRYRAVSLRVTVATEIEDRTLLARRLRAALARYLDAVVGGDDGDGWPFGRPLRPSELMRVAQDTVAQEGGVEAVGIDLDDRGRFEDCGDTSIGPHELVQLHRLDLIRAAAGSADRGRGSL